MSTYIPDTPLNHMPTDVLMKLRQSLDEEIQRRQREDTKIERAAKRLKRTVLSTTIESLASEDQSEIWRLVGCSGFLRSQDLGRLLLLSSKAILEELTPQFAYALIYKSRLTDRWASPHKGEKDWVPRSVIQARGYESVLKSMESSPVVKSKISVLPTIPNAKPALNAQNTIMIVSFWILSQKIYSRQLSPEEMKRFAKTGRIDLRAKQSLFQIANMCFQKNAKLSRKLRDIQRKNGCNKNTNSNENTKEPDSLIICKIYCIRLDTNQTCTLYHSEFSRFEMQRTRMESDQVRFPVQRALKNTEQGDRWVSRWFEGWPEGIQNFGGLTFSVMLKQHSIHLESLVFGKPGQAQYLQTRHGVTAFHLLEGLDGWR